MDFEFIFSFAPKIPIHALYRCLMVRETCYLEDSKSSCLFRIPLPSEDSRQDTLDPSSKLEQLRIDRSAPRAPRALRRPLLLLLLAAIFGAAAFVYFFFALGSADAFEVRLASARLEAGAPSAPSVLDASGYVVARRMATVSAEVTGKVVEVLIEEGMAVKQGDLLARLEDDIARAQLDLFKSRLESGKAAIAEIDINIEQGRLDLERTAALSEQQLVSASAFDQARLSLQALRARRASVLEDIKVAERELEIQQRYLNDMLIRAPFDGVVVAKTAQPGEIISPMSAGGGFTRTGICTIVDMSSLEVEVDVNEAYINRVKAGQPVQVVLNAWPDDPYAANTIAIVPTADRSKATVRVRIGFVNRDDRVLPDMGVKVAFLEEEVRTDAGDQPSKVTIPSSAVLREGGETFVLVYNNGVVNRIEISLGETRAARAEVLAGLQGGERLVVSPSEALQMAAREGGEVAVTVNAGR